MINQDDIRGSIIEKLDIAALPQEAQDDIIAIAGGSVLQSVTAAVLSRMPDEAQQQFTAAFTGGDGEIAEKLIHAHIPDADAFVSQEIEKATSEFAERYAKSA